MARKSFRLSLAKAMMQRDINYARISGTLYDPKNAPLICLGDYAEPEEEIVAMLQDQGFTINEAQ